MTHKNKIHPTRSVCPLQKNKQPTKKTPTSNNRKKNMIRTAVETYSELLAAASPCRQTSCESMEPTAYLRSSGQVVAQEAGQVMCHLPAGCCRDRGTHRTMPLPRFAVVGGSSRIRALSLILHPETPTRPWQEEARSCQLPGWGWVQSTPCSEGERWEMQ